MKTQSPLFVLLGAAKYLGDHGWKRGGYGDDGGPRCAFGAMLSAAGVEKTKRWSAYTGVAHAIAQNALDTAAKTLRRCIHQDYRTSSIIEWNELPQQTQSHVIARMLQAAEIHEMSANVARCVRDAHGAP